MQIFRSRINTWLPHRQPAGAIELTMVLGVAIICLLGGCSKQFQTRQAPVSPMADEPTRGPTNFIRDIASADRIIVTNTFTNWDPKCKGVSFTISGPKAKRLIHALNLLKGFPPNSGVSLAICDWQLQFYRGRSCLATAQIQDCVIRCEGGEYCDHTGTLEKLYKEIMDKIYPNANMPEN